MIEIDFTTKPEPILPEYVFDEYGSKCLLDEMGEFHSYDDLPAVIWSNGSKEWFKHGKLHRDNEFPAAVCFNGTKQYFVNGKLVREEQS